MAIENVMKAHTSAGFYSGIDNDTLPNTIISSNRETRKVHHNDSPAVRAPKNHYWLWIHDGQVDSCEVKRELSKSYEASIKWLLKDLYESKREVTRVESNMVGALVNSMDVIKRQAALEELASAKRRAEEERAGHNATKMAAMEREVELEHRAIESSIALAWIQLTVADERTAKATKLEQKVALLEAWQEELECARQGQREAENKLSSLEARLIYSFFFL
ncbi:hypothetical protein JHK85_048313 [Glycine max]|nr:hypothetical protein JHK85_048313 [Glycine max]